MFRLALLLYRTFFVLTFILSGCATTGATYRSGVGDSFPEHPPYYAGERLSAVASSGATIGHLAVAFQRGAVQSATFDPRGDAGSPVERLLGEMNAYLDSLGLSVRLADAGRGGNGRPPAAAVPPDVRFGCQREVGLADGDCAERGDSALGRDRQAMHLAVGRPSPEWTAWLSSLLQERRVDRALVITLEVGDYLVRQEGWRGSKVVELGTGYKVSLPWLTSLETPVSVLQLTGALVEADGRAVRIGAEGILARRTRLLVSAVGGQELLGDDDVESVRTLRREDLPGEPLAWRVALRELVARLTGKAVGST